MGLSQNEIEHRRGLVLGLTLAEIMLLLLFVLLLTLGKLISDQAQLAQAANDKVSGLKRAITQFKPIMDQIEKHGESADLDILMDKLARLNALETENQGLKADVAAMQSAFELVRKLGPNSADKIAAIQEVYQSAARINPEDPPEALKRAVDLLDEFGPVLDSDLVKIVREASNNKEQLLALIEKAKTGSRSTKVADTDNSKHKWPPIITLSDAEGYSFKVGSAELSQEFQSKLRVDITDQLLDHIAKYEVDIIEVVGHTDETGYKTRTSNLDNVLPEVVLGKSNVDEITPADNAGLGLARAVSVARFLQQDKRLEGYSILPYSGGQLIELGDRMSDGLSTNEDRRRRRIELRVRQKKKVETSQSQVASPPADKTTTESVHLPTGTQEWQQKTRHVVAGRTTVIDGDTIRVDGFEQNIRLVGFNAPEIRNSGCEDEARLGVNATNRLRELASAADLDLELVRCACKPGTEGSKRCNFGRYCGVLRAQGRDVGATLISEGLAVPFTCRSTSCPKMPRPWCE